MSVSVLQLLDLCNRTYEKSDFVAGPLGRDGASVFTLPDGEIVIAFRGTLVEHDLRSALDWLQDTHADLVHAGGFPGKVHRGFLDSLNALWDDVFAAVEGVRKPSSTAAPEPLPWWQRLWKYFDGANPFAEGPALPPPLPWNKTLYITGHSKGGAVAQLAAVRLAALNPKVVTFGAPLVGNVEFAAQYPNISVTRMEGDRDLVPLLPGVMFGYRETPGACHTQSGFTRQWREMLIGRMIAEGGWEQVKKNHSLDTYRTWVSDEPPRGKPTAEAA